MRLIALILLLLNIGFFYWLWTLQPPASQTGSATPPPLPAEVPRLVLLKEAPREEAIQVADAGDSRPRPVTPISKPAAEQSSPPSRRGGEQEDMASRIPAGTVTPPVIGEAAPGNPPPPAPPPRDSETGGAGQDSGRDGLGQVADGINSLASSISQGIALLGDGGGLGGKIEPPEPPGRFSTPAPDEPETTRRLSPSARGDSSTRTDNDGNLKPETAPETSPESQPPPLATLETQAVPASGEAAPGQSEPRGLPGASRTPETPPTAPEDSETAGAEVQRETAAMEASAPATSGEGQASPPEVADKKEMKTSGEIAPSAPKADKPGESPRQASLETQSPTPKTPEPAPPRATAAPPAKGVENSPCYRLGPYSTKSAAEELAAHLATKGASQITQIREYGRPGAEGAVESWWVYLPPYPSRAAARAEIQRLENVGIQDYYVIGKPPLENAISLGLYRDQNSVSRRLAELRAKGYDSVKVQPRHRTGVFYWVETHLRPNGHQILRRALKGMEATRVGCEQLSFSGGF